MQQEGTDGNKAEKGLSRPVGEQQGEGRSRQREGVKKLPQSRPAAQGVEEAEVDGQAAQMQRQPPQVVQAAAQQQPGPPQLQSQGQASGQQTEPRPSFRQGFSIGKTTKDQAGPTYKKPQKMTEAEPFKANIWK